MSTKKLAEWRGSIRGSASPGEPCTERHLRNSKDNRDTFLQNLIEANYSNFTPQQRHYLPLDVREENYEKFRARIFGPRMLSKRILKVRQKFKERKRTRQFIVNSVLRAKNNRNDQRVFIEVEINGHTLTGLLDSGASVSILG